MLTGPMPAAVYVGGGTIELQEVPIPSLAEDEVLVEVSHCGICGTDLHLVLEEYARPGSVLGHEWSGTVAAVGSASQWEVGQRVVGRPAPGCGRCRPCRRGRPSVCLDRPAPDHLSFSGAFCGYLAVSSSRLCAVPDDLSLRYAALTEPTAIALHTVRISDVEADDRVLITGGGPVGLLTLAVLRSQGVTDVTVTDPSPVRRDRAQALGATTLAPEALSPAPMGRPVGQPFAVAFECSGRAKAAESALDQLDYGGTLIFVGTGHDLPRVNHNRMIVLELSAIGAYNYDDGGFEQALDLLANGELALDLLVEPLDVPLRDLGMAMRELAAGAIASKLLASPHADGTEGGRWS